MNPYERILKLLGSILGMVVDGTRDPEKVAKMLEALKETFQKIVDETKTYLKELFTDVPVDATDGTETFQSSELFTGGIYGVAVPAVAKGKPTLATKATVWEMILDATFALMFGGLGKTRKRWTEAQVVWFCRNRSKFLRKDGFATFFEMEGDVVAGVCIGVDGRLSVYVDKFSDVNVWYAKYQHRLVTPQQ